MLALKWVDEQGKFLHSFELGQQSPTQTGQLIPLFHTFVDLKLVHTATATIFIFSIIAIAMQLGIEPIHDIIAVTFAASLHVNICRDQFSFSFFRFVKFVKFFEILVFPFNKHGYELYTCVNKEICTHVQNLNIPVLITTRVTYLQVLLAE